MKEDMNGVTLTNAYGRNPKTMEAVLNLFEAGSDFKINHPSHRWNGAYCSIRDCRPGDVVKLRYNSNRDAVMVSVDEDGVKAVE